MKCVDIILHDYCNFSCSYCISGSQHRPGDPIHVDDEGNLKIVKDLRLNHNGTKSRPSAKSNNIPFKEPDFLKWLKDNGHLRHKFLDLDILTKYIREQLPDWTLCISGGEPLLHPKIDEFLTEITKTNKVILLTNASKLMKFPKLLDIAPDRIFYRIGYHPEFRSIPAFLKIMEYVKSNDMNYVVNYVLHPEYASNGLHKAHIDLLVDNDIEREVTRFEGNGMV